jgi:hypothetical protein
MRWDICMCLKESWEDDKISKRFSWLAWGGREEHYKSFSSGILANPTVTLTNKKSLKNTKVKRYCTILHAPRKGIRLWFIPEFNIYIYIYIYIGCMLVHKFNKLFHSTVHSKFQCRGVVTVLTDVDKFCFIVYVRTPVYMDVGQESRWFNIVLLVSWMWLQRKPDSFKLYIYMGN